MDIRSKLICGLAGVATPAAAVASTGTGAAGPVLPSLLRLAGALALVLALAFGLKMALRRVSRRRGGAGSRAMTVLDVLPLGARTRLVAVRIGGRVHVVGAGDGQVSAVADLDEVEYLAAAPVEEQVLPLRDRLRRLARK